VDLDLAVTEVETQFLLFLRGEILVTEDYKQVWVSARAGGEVAEIRTDDRTLAVIPDNDY
jgi:hypothetical protein